MKPTFDLKNACCNVVFCGVGGEGILTASELAGVAVMLAGHRVKKSEVHGMSQRGGSVESHLRFGAKVHSPLIQPGHADIIVCTNKDEGKRLAFYLKEGGITFEPLLAQAHTQTDTRGINVYLCGVLAALLPLKTSCWFEALPMVIVKRTLENVRSFEAGLKLGTSLFP